ncbi:uncharacterized protein LOC131667526 [Phymastichus coffea]|uniref:uncharacterized protein LOC131667526 n=1 Tax=Phymastichus coffea TaxID=108790 RepID=UPI00273CA6E5|nr:uncharacterized protein LOC131667526 [Phymastichus coffea]
MENHTNNKRCRVKYIEGEKQGECDTVCSSRIKNHDFKNCVFQKNLKYKLMEETDETKITRVQIIFVTETQKEMDKKLETTRIVSAPAKLLESDQASDSDNKIAPCQSTSRNNKTRSTFKVIIYR